MATNTNKLGYSVADLSQIIGCTGTTIIKMVDRKDLEALIDDPKTPGGRRKIRFTKEHIQHYMLRHFDKFDDVTLRTWGVLSTPKKFVANAATPRIPIDAFSKEVEGTPTKPSDTNPNMAPTTAKAWSSPAPKKPYIRTEEVKAQERAAQSAPPTARVPYSHQSSTSPIPKFQKNFPKFRISVNGGEIVIPGIESFTAGEIAKALLTDRNFRTSEITITFDGVANKEE